MEDLKRRVDEKHLFVNRPKTGDFAIKKGPVFHNIILADEINRAPGKNE